LGFKSNCKNTFFSPSLVCSITGLLPSRGRAGQHTADAQELPNSIVENANERNELADASIV
jgi:hypothetical protein